MSDLVQLSGTESDDDELFYQRSQCPQLKTEQNTEIQAWMEPISTKIKFAMARLPMHLLSSGLEQLIQDLTTDCNLPVKEDMLLEVTQSNKDFAQLLLCLTNLRIASYTIKLINEYHLDGPVQVKHGNVTYTIPLSRTSLLNCKFVSYVALKETTLENLSIWSLFLTADKRAGITMFGKLPSKKFKYAAFTIPSAKESDEYVLNRIISMEDTGYRSNELAESVCHAISSSLGWYERNNDWKSIYRTKRRIGRSKNKNI